ncbi:unnamed protein product [Litomosoides sigmodontis]|uniref:BPTI/Kunitz inhibitor domain-containing protein n=1 Tax=Litomosoides sigmodontis TaxID=42156 RepID=A0A3P6TIP6_LITSI|nr:unnamed protein product [Litomosoides sigmodontis]
MLFEHAECEDFLSDEKWSAVGLRDCKPYVCDFPHELCRRPAAKYQDEMGNKCSRIPDNVCLTAANGGTPLAANANSVTNNGIASANIGKSELPTATSSLPTYSNEFSTALPSSTQIGGNTTEITTKSTDSLEDICNLDQPQGRYCGFALKVAYNRNNRRCEEFWFPGCRTIQTNQNLFDSVEECLQRTSTGSFVPFFTTHHPAVPASVETLLPPVPLVAPYLATTKAPRAEVPKIIKTTFIKPTLVPTLQPQQPQPWINEISSEVEKPYVRVVGRQSSLKPPQLTAQPYWLTSPSSAGSILGLISSGISQFTGARSDETGGDGSLFHHLPQFLRLLQGR